MTFDFNFWDVRVLEIEGNPWFVAKDICQALNHTNSRVAISSLDDDEKGVRKVYTLGGMQELTIINESGLYSLIVRSNKPEAKIFKKWVTSEVLPAIRKHGGYLTPAKTEEILANPDLLIQLATQLKFERNEKAKLRNFISQKNELIETLASDSKYLREELEAEGEMTVTEVAKGFGMSGRKLNSILLDLEIIYKVGQTYVLYAKYDHLGLTKTRVGSFVSPEGKQMASWQLVWTLKGRKFIYDLLQKKGF